uniref:Uncharacterized protein n=1 Tax=virus sp. ctiha2 TaxID=2827299 RepID=A0A8S5RH83_9VIRU|nr:MAG TPA: hypothetical protein [virus sp. ctiha2]DAE89614.1 MAG TPA: hypothetical protein [Bacteriophage sp.]DAX13837.1 MAG TPA: hypothetical protein [Bacteriophage sp.]
MLQYVIYIMKILGIIAITNISFQNRLRLGILKNLIVRVENI